MMSIFHIILTFYRQIDYLRTDQSILNIIMNLSMQVVNMGIYKSHVLEVLNKLLFSGQGCHMNCSIQILLIN